MIEFFLEFIDLIRVLLGIFCGIFIGIWFSLSMMTWFERNPYRIVDPKPEPKHGNPGDVKQYDFTPYKNFRNPAGGD